MKRSMLSLAAALALGASVGAAGADDAPQDILIGAAIPLSGPAAPVGGFINGATSTRSPK